MDASWADPRSTKSSFWNVIFTYCTQQRTISLSDCDTQRKVNFLQWPANTSSVAGLRRSAKALPKAKTCTKKRSSSLFGGLLLIWSTSAFWIPAKLFYLRSMLSKSMSCPENCNACSRHLSTERTQFFSMTRPNCTSHSQHFKSWMNWAVEFYLICHVHLTSCQPATTPSSILATFCRENGSTTSIRQKMLSKSLSNP